MPHTVIKNVHGQQNALNISDNQTEYPTVFLENKGSGDTLHVVQEGSGEIAQFRGTGKSDGVSITEVAGDNIAFAIYKNKTSKSALWVKQEGTGSAATFKGGGGVDIKGVSGQKNALNISDNQTENSTAYVENNGSGRALRVKQLGQGAIAWLQGKSDRAKLSVNASDDGESIHLEIYQGEQPVWTPTNNLSDLTLAEDVAPIENALDKVLSLEGVSFSWQDKALGESKEIGVSAEKVGEVLPELVHSADGQSGLVKYEKFVPVLIEAIKAQQKQIEQLQQEVKDLKGQVGSQPSQGDSEEEYVPDF